MTERFEVDTWEFEGEPVGRVLVLPGGFYPVESPILYWACQVAAGAGWQVTTMRWTVDEAARREPARFVEQAADLLAARAPAAPRTVIIGKSLGTRAAPWANARGWSGVWLTPLLTEPVVRDALTGDGPPATAIGGTADPVWDGAVARRLRGTVVELAGADHALHVGTDWRASLDALTRAVEAVEVHLLAQSGSDRAPRPRTRSVSASPH